MPLSILYKVLVRCMPYVDLKILVAVIYLLLLINTEMINAFEK